MENDKMISVEKVVRHYEVELSFIRSLEEFGLVEVTTVGDEKCIDSECLGDIERMIRLHYDLEINLEGIDVIYNMLQKIKMMQAELNHLKNRTMDFNRGAQPAESD